MDYEVIDEWDGCWTGRVHHRGDRNQCIAWMRMHWDAAADHYGWREEFADGFGLRNRKTGKLESFIL